MSANVLVIASRQAGTGKTHLAAALCRLLRTQGHHVAPLHLSTRTGDPVACPEGGSVTRAAALLAEACGLLPEPWMDSDWGTLPSLMDPYDTVIVEAGPNAEIPAPFQPLMVERSGRNLRVDGGPVLAWFSPDLMPAMHADVAELPLWTVQQAPRAAILSLPHITNFTDFRLVRASEWITVGAPGRFEVVFIPATSNEHFDLEWMKEMGLDAWLDRQRGLGCRLVVTGWDFDNAERHEPGDLTDHVILSRILRRRVPPPLPDEETLDHLAGWAAGRPELAAVWKRLPAAQQ